MATRRTGGKAAGDDFAQAARDYADEMSDATGGEVHVALTRSVRKGIWVVKTRLVRVRAGRVVLVIAERRADWPNSEGLSLGAVLLNEVMKLDRAALVAPPSEQTAD